MPLPLPRALRICHFHSLYFPLLLLLLLLLPGIGFHCRGDIPSRLRLSGCLCGCLSTGNPLHRRHRVLFPSRLQPLGPPSPLSRLVLPPSPSGGSILRDRFLFRLFTLLFRSFVELLNVLRAPEFSHPG